MCYVFPKTLCVFIMPDRRAIPLPELGCQCLLQVFAKPGSRPQRGGKAAPAINFFLDDWYMGSI